jgi:DNA recombination protein RmuC
MTAQEGYKADIETYKAQANTVKQENARLVVKFEENEKRLQEQQQFIDGAKERLNVTFQALSAEALEKNNTSFVTLAKETLDAKLKEAQGDLAQKEEAIKGLVKPLDESLKLMDGKINELEKTRTGAYRDIFNHLEQVKLTTEGLKKETSNLVGALKTSHSRGRYGEIALRRLVEFAGMIDHCHFDEQVTVQDEGGKLRPDMIIKLPENKKLVVDSKVPLASYLKIFETDDPDQQQTLVNLHNLAVKDHLKKLSAKAYWSQFDEAPDFVIMYMHIESSFGTAIQSNPELIEEAFKNRIIIATPTILISILMSVGYSWNQIKTMENIEEIRSAAVELYERSTVFVGHLVGMGNNLQSTVDYYNKAVGSFEGNFMPQARKINNLSQAYTKKILKDLEPIELATRRVSADLPQIESSTENPKTIN